MRSHADDNKSVVGFSNDEEEPIGHGVAGDISLPLKVGNDVFHVTSTMLYLLQIKGLFVAKQARLLSTSKISLRFANHLR